LLYAATVAGSEEIAALQTRGISFLPLKTSPEAGPTSKVESYTLCYNMAENFELKTGDTYVHTQDPYIYPTVSNPALLQSPTQLTNTIQLASHVISTAI